VPKIARLEGGSKQPYGDWLARRLLLTSALVWLKKGCKEEMASA